MKVKCPDCKEAFDLNVNEVDEGDYVECPECSLDLVVIVKAGKLKVKSEKEKFYEETELDRADEDSEE